MKSFYILAFVAVFALAAPLQGQTFTTLYKFTGEGDGGYPYGGVVRDASGNLYGTTNSGIGAACGVVFKVNRKGKETVLHKFQCYPTDGAGPEASVLRDKVGKLYGTTDVSGSFGYGAVFEVDPIGKEKLLYSFRGGSSDGCYPQGNLIMDKDGNLYGTTSQCGSSNRGIIFKLNKKGKLTLLHSFVGGPNDGQYPTLETLIMDKTGNLYGVTYGGGTSNYGTVFELNTKGKLALLHSFAGGVNDGCFPYGAPAMDKVGNLYGTTYSCGSSNQGTVWEVNKDNAEVILHNFAGPPSDGAYPYSGVVRDSKGNLYGVTNQGGASYWGAIYELSNSGILTLLHSFAGTDGGDPVGTVLLDWKGDLYGTTECSGYCFGTVWSYTP